MRHPAKQSNQVQSVGTLLAGLTATCLVSSCSNSPADSRENSFQSTAHIQAPSELSACAELVDSYVSSNKRWATVDYNLTVAPFGGTATSFEVHHIDDVRAPQIEGGKSIVVEADCSANKVLRELAYQ